MNYTEYTDLLNLIKQEFSEIVKVESIGQTIDKNQIMMIKFEKNQSNPGILFTGITLNHEGMHHAREPVSFLMCINILMKILIEYTKGDKTMIELVKSRNIYFIPIINVDGFILNTKIYQNTSNFGMARKNGRKDVIFSQCNG